MKKNKAKKMAISLLCAIFIVALGTSVAGNVILYNKISNFDIDREIALHAPIDENLVVDIENTPQIALHAGETYAVMTANEQVLYLEKTLTATVYPEDATNKAVDWSVHVRDGESGLEVIPESDGSCVAVVRYYKECLNGGTITVTTREGNHSATCRVKYSASPWNVLTPSSLQVLGSNGTEPFVQNQAIANDGSSIGLYPHPEPQNLETYSDMETVFGYYRFTVVYKEYFNKTYEGYYGGGISSKDLDFRVKFSDGTAISASDFVIKESYTNLTKKYEIEFAVSAKFANTYRNKLKTNSDIHVVFDFYNTFYKRSIRTLKIYFSIPTSSVSVSDTEVLL